MADTTQTKAMKNDGQQRKSPMLHPVETEENVSILLFIGLCQHAYCCNEFISPHNSCHTYSLYIPTLHYVFHQCNIYSIDAMYSIIVIHSIYGTYCIDDMYSTAVMYSTNVIYSTVVIYSVVAMYSIVIQSGGGRQQRKGANR